MFSCIPPRTAINNALQLWIPTSKDQKYSQAERSDSLFKLFFPGDCSWLSLHQLFSKPILSLPLFVQFKQGNPCWWVSTPADSNLPTGDMRYVLWGREKHEPAGSYRAGILKDTKQLDSSLPQMEQQQPISSRINFSLNACFRLFRLQGQVNY